MNDWDIDRWYKNTKNSAYFTLASVVTYDCAIYNNSRM